jgi:hypothetical protein
MFRLEMALRPIPPSPRPPEAIRKGRAMRWRFWTTPQEPDPEQVADMQERLARAERLAWASSLTPLEEQPGRRIPRTYVRVPRA